MFRHVQTVMEQVRSFVISVPDCHGTGYVSNRKTIEVTVPAGIDNGQSIRIRGKGEPGTNGGPRGDLLVEVIVERHPKFQRQDTTIYSTEPISFTQAALGGKIQIPTVDGPYEYTIKPGTQTDTRIRLKGKGVPMVRNKNVRGDHYVTLVVQVPEHLNGEQRAAFRNSRKLWVKFLRRKKLIKNIKDSLENIKNKTKSDEGLNFIAFLLLWIIMNQIHL